MKEAKDYASYLAVPSLQCGQGAQVSQAALEACGPWPHGCTETPSKGHSDLDLSNLASCKRGGEFLLC